MQSRIEPKAPGVVHAVAGFDEQLEFLHAGDDATRSAVLDRYHRRLMEVQPYALLGQFDPPFVWRKALQGVLPASVVVWRAVT